MGNPMPEPEPETDVEATLIDIAIPPERSTAEKKDATGKTISLAFAILRPVPPKPRGYPSVHWKLLTDLLKQNQLVEDEDFGSKKQCDISNSLIAMVGHLISYFQENGLAVDRWESLFAVGVLITPLASGLYDLHQL